MKTGFVRGVLDNDPKGLTGVGTIFYVDITVDGVTERHTWGLLDEIAGRFDVNKVLASVVQALKDEEARTEKDKADAKKAIKDAREAGVRIDPDLRIIIDHVLQEDQKAVTEFKGGKEKALNSLVGKVIGQIKKQKLSLDTDAFTINRALREAMS